MKEYPTIPGYIRNIPIYAFNKLDGSNIRAEWTRKNGFNKFGSRTELIDETHTFLGEAPALVRAKYEKELTDVFRKKRYEKVLCFFEFFGSNSFAGNHVADEPHEVVLFDVSVYKKGIMPPSVFLELTKTVEIPEVVYTGKCNNAFVEDVRNMRIPQVIFEGVVCKSNEMKGFGQPIMFKIKTLAWLEKLKDHCGNDKVLYYNLM